MTPETINKIKRLAEQRAQLGKQTDEAREIRRVIYALFVSDLTKDGKAISPRAGLVFFNDGVVIFLDPVNKTEIKL